MPQRFRSILAALICAIAASVCSAQETPTWHADNFSHRATVEVTERRGSDVDTAAVRVHHAGVMQPSANDLRIYNADGQRVPYHVAYHHPKRDTLIKFHAPQGQDRLYIYFGNASASVDPCRTVPRDKLGIKPPEPGPQADGWTPRAGLTLTTMRRPTEAPNPETVEQFTALVEQSAGLDGAAMRANIRDGLNPFGDSDHYLSIYHGWLRIPEDGTYTFCTASNEASFSFIDGDTLVHWPGRHTEKRGQLGQKNETHQLNAGLHYVTYLHEEVLLYQVAFLGYRPPGKNHFVQIPDELFVQPHRAAVQRYGQRGQRGNHLTVMPNVALLDSVWPQARDDGQYTRMRLTATAGEAQHDLSDWTFQWHCGDGITQTGRRIEHVYLATGEYTVTLRATAPDGRTIERQWPVTVFPIEHLRGPFKRGDRNRYASIVESYDTESLNTASRLELAHYFFERGQYDQARRVAEQALDRNDADEARIAELHLLAAGSAGLPETTWTPKPDADTAQTAARHLRAALNATETEATEADVQRMRIFARLVRHQGIALEDMDAATKTYEQAETFAREAGLTQPMKAALRDTAIAAGDAHLVARRFDAAEDHYRTAEALAQPIVPQPVRAAQIGGYPETIAQALDSDRIDDAAETARRWRERFPADLVTGEPPFWLGKVALRQEAPANAVRPLQLAIERGHGAHYEAEARWRLAEAYRQLDKDEAQRSALRELVQTGLASEYRDKARAELEKLQ